MVRVEAIVTLLDFNQMGGMLRCLDMITGKSDVVREEVTVVRRLWNMLSICNSEEEIVTITAESLKVTLMAILGIYKGKKSETLGGDKLVSIDPLTQTPVFELSEQHVAKLKREFKVFAMNRMHSQKPKHAKFREVKQEDVPKYDFLPKKKRT